MHTAWFQGMHTVGYYLFIGLINPDIFSYGSFSHPIPGNVLAEDTISYPRKICVPHKHSTPAPEAPMCFPGENRLFFLTFFFLLREGPCSVLVGASWVHRSRNTVSHT